MRTSACRLDADEHHLGLAPRTGGALEWSQWNGGRQALGLDHGASLMNRREHNTLSLRYCRGAELWPSSLPPNADGGCR